MEDGTVPSILLLLVHIFLRGPNISVTLGLGGPNIEGVQISCYSPLLPSPKYMKHCTHTHTHTYSPVVVADDANIEVACQRIMWGKCINAGQSCVAPDYILCSPAIKDQLVGGLQAAVKRFFGEVSFFCALSYPKFNM